MKTNLFNILPNKGRRHLTKLNSTEKLIKLGREVSFLNMASEKLSIITQ
jgi:hypothetical protein